MAILDNYKNLSLAQIATPPSPPASGTSLTLMAGQGAYLPAPPFNATIFGGATFPTPTTAEIVRVTAIAGDVATIVRQQENTAARAILAGDYVAATFTTKFITDLRDSSNQSAGTLPDARLSANVALKNVASPQVFAGALQSASDVTEKGRTVPIGHWTAVPFLAANFTANSGTWTVEAADVTTYAYMLIGKTMWVVANVATTSVSGNPTYLQVAIPGGYTAAAFFSQPSWVQNNAQAWNPGFSQVVAGGNVIRLARDGNLTSWGAATNATAVHVQLYFQVN